MTSTTKPLTVKEAAVQLRLSSASVYGLCTRQKLRHSRVGIGRGKIVVPVESIVEYLAAREVLSTERGAQHD